MDFNPTPQVTELLERVRALGLSIAFIERFDTVVSDTLWQLGWDWGLLGSALFASLYRNISARARTRGGHES